MARGFYSHEMSDQDLEWLVTEFLSERSNFLPIETGSSCLLLVPYYEPIQLQPESEANIEVPVTTEDQHHVESHYDA